MLSSLSLSKLPVYAHYDVQLKHIYCQVPSFVMWRHKLSGNYWLRLSARFNFLMKNSKQAGRSFLKHNESRTEKLG